MKKTTTEVASNIRGGNYAIEYIKSIRNGKMNLRRFRAVL